MREPPVQPGDLIHLVVQLRQLMSTLEANSFLIEGSFERYGLEAENAATSARPAMAEAAMRLYDLLEVIEKTAEFKKQRQQHAATPHGKGRYG